MQQQVKWCLKCGQERSQIGRCTVCGKLVTVIKKPTREPLLDHAAMTRLLEDLRAEDDEESLEQLLAEIHWGLDDQGA